jgi:hypothetical protein
VRRFKALTAMAVWTTSAVMVLALAPSARADYGGGAAKNTWQFGISFNCNSRAACGPDLGGFWGWAELDQTVGANPTYTGDAKFSFCFHGGTGPGGAGAGSTSEDVSSWTVGDNGNFWLTGGTDVDRFQGQIFVHPIFASDQYQPDPSNPTVAASPSTPQDIGIPAAAGTYHLSTVDIFGFSAPGVTAVVQVAYRPAR